ncbi:MAG: AMP-binding protein [Reichenbachiella sp.]
MQKFTAPLEAFHYWEKQIPKSTFLNQPIDGAIISYSYEQVGIEARKIAEVIKGYDLPERSHIALLSKNCAHWHMADLAIMMAGHVSIPIYPTLNEDTINQILVHSESKAIIVGKLDDFEAQKPGIPDIHQICVGLYGNQSNTMWENIVSTGKEIEQSYEQKPEDLYTIIYTSGTTGDPKGVMHTVENMMNSVYGLGDFYGIENNVRVFSFLPIAHVAERILENISITFGATVNFPETLESFAADLSKTQPYIFFAVPRIWAKFQEKILDKLPQKKLDTLLKIPILSGIIKKKLRTKLGLNEARFILSGAAPIAPSLVEWFNSIGINIMQAYGMTEDGCISHCNRPGANTLGTVGKALPDAEVKLSPEGEICIKNNCLMKGYFKSPEMTASVFDEEGYFKTGDIGEYDHDGFLTITGRVKDQFKTDKGKYISPGPIELEMSKCSDIDQICIVGTGIPQPIALITLSELGRAKTKEGLTEALIKIVELVNPQFEKHEKVHKVIVMKEEWNVANGLTTPTLKVKRNSIEKIHQPFYKEWFDHEEKVLFE